MPRRKGQGALPHVLDAKQLQWRQKAHRERLAKAVGGPSDRELIERALAEGRVTICPPGTAMGDLRWTKDG
jgi:hypothetical protein